jgi:hypothetical protein
MKHPPFPTLRQRQVAFGICCGMSPAQIGQAIGLGVYWTRHVIHELLPLYGCDDRVEFAVNVNAAVRHEYQKAKHTWIS